MQTTTKIAITILGSGSSGNSILIHTASEGILIDAGFSRKETLARLKTNNINPNIIHALLISHGHGDHIKGARVLAKHLNIPTYISNESYELLQDSNRLNRPISTFEPGNQFNIGPFTIKPFALQHDYPGTVGFVVTSDNRKIGIATDLGQVNNLALQRLHDCHALILESNYDEEMLGKSGRPLHLIRRIMGKHGHLSNTAAIASLDELLTDKTSNLFLAHLSRECNHPKVVEDLAKEKLTELNRNDIVLYVAEQTQPLATVWI